MADLALFERLTAGDNHLGVLTTARSDRTVHASVVSVGVLADPVDGSDAVGLVAQGNSVKLAILRQSGRATVVVKHGYQWASAAGSVRLIGPDDGSELGLDVPGVIRSVYRAAGGDHEDWEEFDRVMRDERRCAVFVRAERITSNAGT
jgi:hypothetical protein